VQQAEGSSAPSSRQLLRTVYSLYRGQFRRWFAITAPTSLLAAVVVLIADQQIRAIFRSIPRFEFLRHLAEIAEAGVLRFGSFFISWLLGCFALAAIATVVSGLDADDSDNAWKHDSHQRAREHLGSLLLAALVTFCAFLAGMAVLEFVEFAVIQKVGWSHFSRFNLGLALVGSVIVASVISWLGMAIPLILRENTAVWTALKRSVKLSDGHEGFLFLLVVESVAGSYLAWYTVHYTLWFLLPAHLRYTVWYGWVVYALAVLASAAVQPPLFIGFSLLADHERFNVLSFPGPQQTA
jgi:hypothetical protein